MYVINVMWFGYIHLNYVKNFESILWGFAAKKKQKNFAKSLKCKCIEQNSEKKRRKRYKVKFCKLVFQRDASNLFNKKIY